MNESFRNRQGPVPRLYLGIRLTRNSFIQIGMAT